MRFDIRKNIFTSLFSVHNALSLSYHEQVRLNSTLKQLLQYLDVNVKM